MKRQNLRKLLLILAMLLFPITIWYFSPALIIMGALEGIINGSFIVFIGMFVFSIFFGRFFCGYLCPMGGLQECLEAVNDKSPRQGWKNYIKYVIWIIWIGIIVFCFVNKGKIVKIDFLYKTDHGISIANIYSYIIYYGVILLVLIPAIVGGKRVFCHYICWMAPFMTAGIKFRRLLHLPGLYVKADQDKCISCMICNKKCPMGLDVCKMAKTGACDSLECIQCGVCIDSCPKKVLGYSMKPQNNKSNKRR